VGWVLVGYFAFAYVLIFLAARLPMWCRKIGARNDYSYGMYVYGFLVQQYTAFLGWHLWGYVPWVAATLVVTACLACLSWHVVEKPALRLKDRGPGRGIRYWLAAWRARGTQPVATS
jgi:peptidoglycan/LPS O-acetylase OafA/YrhL